MRSFPIGSILPIRTVAATLAAAHSFFCRQFNLDLTDPEEIRYPAKISVWVRWFICVACLIELIYRPVFTYFTYAAYILCFLVLVVLNGYVHYRVQTGRTVTLHWILALSAMDVILITGGMIVAGGFSHFFFYLLYYPALVWFAVFFSSYRLSFGWVTMVALLYVVVSLTAGEGLDFDARDEKALFARIVVMYAIVASVNLVSSSERNKRREAVERERELHRERVQLTQTIHDTTAQSAYMIGMGIETAIELADKSNQELVDKLEATYELSKSAMWELRHPIDIGLILEGRELGHVLQSHVESFTAITSVHSDVVLRGAEPPLSPVTRSLLFSIAHNALTNAFRHACADKVTIELDFHENGLRMSLSDDGIGLPDDYAVRGHGFKNMRADAERMGGRLDVESGKSGQGTTVTCVVEYNSVEGGT